MNIYQVCDQVFANLPVEDKEFLIRFYKLNMSQNPFKRNKYLYDVVLVIAERLARKLKYTDFEVERAIVHTLSHQGYEFYLTFPTPDFTMETVQNDSEYDKYTEVYDCLTAEDMSIIMTMRKNKTYNDPAINLIAQKLVEETEMSFSFAKWGILTYQKYGYSDWYDNHQHR